MRLLVAEDERALARAIVTILEKNHCSADAVYNGEDALAFAESGHYDALILDIMMPRMNGIEVLRTLRNRGRTIPVLLLTAKSEVADKVQGLDSGADYYLTKPFAAEELMATLRAITRGRTAPDSRLTFGNVTLDRATFELSSPNGCFRLANKEFQMMEMFLAAPRTLISAERFFERIWGCESDTDPGVVWVYISYLRKKLTALEANVAIHASRNAGYRLEVTPCSVV